MNIEEAMDELSAFITMVYERDGISNEELERIEKIENILIHYIYEKENT